MQEAGGPTGPPATRAALLDVVDAALLEALSGEPGPDARAAARDAAQALLDDLVRDRRGGPAEHARALADALASDGPLHDRAMELARAAAAIREADGRPGGNRRPEQRAQVAVLVPDAARREALERAAAGLGTMIALPGAPREIAAIVRAADAPDVVLVQADGDARVAALAAAYEARAAGIPVALVAPNRPDDPDDALLRLSPGLSARELLLAALALADRGRADGARVGVATADGELVGRLTDVLAPLGAEVTHHPAHGLHSTAETIALAPPDALVVDARGTARTPGLTLCRAVRARARGPELGVVVLADAAGDPAETYAAGADDVITDPRSAVLAACLTNRLARLRHLRGAGDADPLTGLPRQREALARIERLRSLSVPDGAALTVAVVTVDGLSAVNQEHGRAVGDALVESTSRLLVAAMRREDVVGRWSGGEFVVAGRGLDPETARRRLQRVVDEARALQPQGTPAGTVLRLSAGVAVHPATATTAIGLVEAAIAAVGPARDRREGAIVLAREDAQAATSLDVLLVEDDRLIARVVEHTLAGQGLRVEVEHDGAAAAARLTGRGRPWPRVVLLDWELPGLDGPAVLRRMREAGTLEATRVIMLTGRSTEDDVLAVMRAGAIDHVPKPFSVPVLVERVRRALLP